MSESEAYPRDTRVIRRGTASSSPPEPQPVSSPSAADDAPTPPAAVGASGVVQELRPYLPRMALGAALVLLADLWWAGMRKRRERRRERKRRNRGRR